MSHKNQIASVQAPTQHKQTWTDEIAGVPDSLSEARAVIAFGPNPIWLRLTRILILFLTLLLLVIFTAGILTYPGYSSSHPGEFTIYTWNVEQMSQMLQSVGLSYQWWLGFNLVISIITAAAFFGVAALLFLRKNSDWFGLYLAFTLFLFGIVLTPIPQVIAGQYLFLSAILQPLSVIAWPLFFIIFFIFPDGHFVPRWTRWVVLVFIITLALMLLNYSNSTPPVPILLFLIVVVGIGVGSQVYRYRKYSTLTQRQQTKWVVFAILILFTNLLLALMPLILPGINNSGTPVALAYLFISSVNNLIFIFLPFSVAIAILRYRLWDIDIIIRKTLVYAVVIGLLALVYIGGIILLQEGIAGLGVRQSPAAIVLSTLAIAVLFNLVRRWLKPRVDRLFFRHNYDADQALAAFSAQTRDEVVLDRINAALVSALEATVQPARANLWVEAGGLQTADSPSSSSGTTRSAFQAKMMEMDIAPDDPLRAHLLKDGGVIEMDVLELDSAALRRLKDARVKLSVPLISQGELIGVLNVGPRRSEQGYSSDDIRLISNLAIRAAPALRVAQLVHQQQFEASRRERIEQELRVARLVQETLLPKDLPSIPGWELAAHWQPAREMSGDFYDFLAFPDGRIGLIIGDVSGKGMPAALVMAITQSILRATAERIVSPAEVLEQANNLIRPYVPANMFATCLYMILDPVTGCLQFANAGHNLPILQTDRGVTEPSATGMPLGLMPGMTYNQNEVQLTPGDRLLMYTDGLVEAHNPQREMFGTPYLHKLIGQKIQLPPGSSGGAALIGLLLASLAGFTGSGWEQEDDVTLVTLDYLGSGRSVEDPTQTKIGVDETFIV